MKKTFCLISLVGFSLILTACNNNNENQPASIIGTWIGVYQPDSDSIFTEQRLSFTEDGQYSHSFILRTLDGDNPEPMLATGIFEIDNNGRITLTMSGGFPGPISEFCDHNQKERTIICENERGWVFVPE